MTRHLSPLAIVIFLLNGNTVAETGNDVAVEYHSQQAESVQTDSDYYQTPPIPGNGLLPEQEVDISGILTYIQQDNILSARSELARWQARYPQWRAPAALNQLLHDPTQLEMTERLYLSRMSTLANTPAKMSNKISAAEMKVAFDAIMIRQDSYHALMLGWLHVQRKEYHKAEHLFEQVEAWSGDPRAREARIELAQHQAFMAAERGDEHNAYRHALHASNLGHNDILISSAWLLYNAGAHAGAARVFRAHQPATEESYYGAILALRASSDNHSALTIACNEARHSSRLLQLCFELSGEQMLADYQAGAYDKVEKHALLLDKLGSLPDDLLSLRAWSLLASGERHLAAKYFDHLLTKHPANQSYADGLLSSLADGKDPAVLEQAANRHPLIRRDRILNTSSQPDNAPLSDQDRITAASSLYHVGNYHQADEHFEYLKLDARADIDPGLTVMAGWSAFHNNRPGRARDLFLHAAMQQSDDTIWLMVAEAELALNNLEKVEAILADQPPSAERNRMQHRLLLRQANMAYQLNNPERTEELLSKIPPPLDSEANEMLGWSRYSLEKYTDAITAFENAYSINQDFASAKGLVLSHIKLGKAKELIALGKTLQGPILELTDDPDVHEMVAQGKERWVGADGDGYLYVLNPEDVPPGALSRTLQRLVGMPGFTWGSIDYSFNDSDTHISYLINQGIDWLVLPGDITLNTFIEYRSIHNQWQAFQSEREVALGVELKRAPFRFGYENIPAAWQEDSRGSTEQLYLSWYHDWYQFLRRRGSQTPNPFNVNAYDGASYGRITHNLDSGTTTVNGFVRQGMDWFTKTTEYGDLTLNTYAAYRFRFRSQDNDWYDAHGPVIGVEINLTPLSLGIDYMHQFNPRRNTSADRFGLYLTWYFDWDLRPQ